MEVLSMKEEKKVEYLELIYDLIFVYIIGRNNTLLHVENGFVSGLSFVAFTLCSFAVIQIWSFSTFYINLYGRNGIREHIFLFVNMYLLYYIGEGTRLHWESFHTQYHVAWALILVNIAVQYAIERRNHRDDPGQRRTVTRLMCVLLGEAALVLLVIPFYRFTGVSLSALPILFGIVGTWLLCGRTKDTRVDFAHLSERAMLYVVFTFGEMIIAIASYFDGAFTANSVYFSLMCFLIVAGLFVGYELLYNKLIDRERQDNGMGYMLIHIFLIFAMNCITASLEFMRDEAVLLLPKTLFLIGALLLHFICLLALTRYIRRDRRIPLPHLLIPIGATAVFAVGMVLLRDNMRINIFVSVIYVWLLALFFLWQSRRKLQSSKENHPYAEP